MHPKFVIIFLALIVLVGLFLWMRKRRKGRRGIQGALQHPGGFVKYHRDTEIHVKTALDRDKNTNKKSEKSAVAVVNFKGDMRASGRFALGRFVDEILLNQDRFAEVVLRVESPGGSVMEYGHAFGEVCRLRDSGISTIVCVDAVAASGGYLMSLPATKILAAPFAFVGSIGVVSFIPNVRRLLEKLNIEPRTFTAGDHKRTITLTDDAGPEQVRHYQEQLQLIHDQFKTALHRYRPNVKLEEVATGETWLAGTSVEKNLQLVDELRLSSDYLLEKNRQFDLVEFSETDKKRGLMRWFKLFGSAKVLVEDLYAKLR